METKHLYTKNYFRASWKFQVDPKRLEELTNKVMDLNPTSVLDVGCGRGYLLKRLRPFGVKVKGTDFSEAGVSLAKDKDITVADAKNLPFKDKTFDLVISTDFFEHIPEEDIDKVYNEMKRVSERVAARIATKEECDKENAYHLTVKPLAWWTEKLPGIIII